ncbi:MAG TPA: serine/threonine-protein kinase, partial [Gemmataceae bacterium]|nr:serine/threonine-protein kinase [Gemmataceae bacterium]
AHLDHPHIVPIYEVGDFGGRPYFSMKLVEGGCLAQQMPRFRHSPRATATLMATLARAVHYAHQRGILHRDLKPGNILLDSQGQPYVTDFGLAARLTVAGFDAETDPASTEMAGTPCYMAPEQAATFMVLADPTKVLPPSKPTTETDVFSLGAILYEILTGKPPFQGQNPLETLDQARRGTIVPVRTYNPRTGRDLAAICEKCLVKDPARRYGSAEALAEDLERWLAGQPIRARVVSSPERLWLWARRKPLVASLWAACALFFLLALAISSWGYWHVDGLNQRLQKAGGEKDLVNHALQQTVNEKTELNRQLFLDRAQLLRQLKAPGFRRLGLGNLQEAARIRPGLDLRNEFVRYLDQYDLGPVYDGSAISGEIPFNFRDKFDAANLWIMAKGCIDLSTGRFRGLSAGRILDWDSQSGQFAESARDPQPKKHSLLSPNGCFLVSWDPIQRGAWFKTIPHPDKNPILLQDKNGNAFIASSIAVNRRSDLLAAATPLTATNHHAIILYKISEGTPEYLREWEVPARGLDDLQFHPSGEILAGSLNVPDPDIEKSSYIHALGLWKVNGHEVLPSFFKLDTDAPWNRCQQPRRLAFSDDGGFLAIAGNRETVRLLDLSPVFRDGNPREIFSQSLYPHWPHDVYLTPDGRWLAAVDNQRTVKVWQVSTRELAAQAALDEPRSSSPFVKTNPIAKSPLAIMTDWKGPKQPGFRLWEFIPPLSRSVRLAPAPETPEESNLFLDSLLFSPDDRWLACSRPGPLSPWLIDLGGPDFRPMPLKGNAGPCICLFSPKCDKISCLSHIGNQKIWQLPTLEVIDNSQLPKRNLAALEWNARGQRIAVVISRDTPFTIANLDAAEDFTVLEKEVTKPQGNVRAFSRFNKTLRLAPGARFLALQDRNENNQVLKVLDLERKTLIFSDVLPGPASCTAIASQGQLVAVGRRGQILLFDPQAQKSCGILEGHQTDVIDLAFDQTASYLVSLGRNGTIHLWDPIKKEMVLQIQSSLINPERIALSPSGRWLAAGDAAGKVQIWDLPETRQHLHQIGLDW